jgi:hypothetical protein
MKKLLQSKPCCYFTRFWKLYLNFTLENREILFSTKSSLALTETSSIGNVILSNFLKHLLFINFVIIICVFLFIINCLRDIDFIIVCLCENESVFLVSNEY